jgi:hypothetical protein
MEGWVDIIEFIFLLNNRYTSSRDRERERERKKRRGYVSYMDMKS